MQTRGCPPSFRPSFSINIKMLHEMCASGHAVRGCDRTTFIPYRASRLWGAVEVPPKSDDYRDLPIFQIRVDARDILPRQIRFREIGVESQHGRKMLAGGGQHLDNAVLLRFF